MTHGRSLLKDVSANSIGEVGSRLPLMLIEIIVARYLGPAVYGIWATVQLAVNYNNFLHFGFFSALAREEPILLAKADNEKADIVRNAAFTTVMCITFLVGILLLITYFAAIKFTPNLTAYSSYIFFTYTLFVLQQIFIFYQTTLQNRFLFMLLSMGKLLYSFSFLLFVILSISTWQLNAVIVSWSASYFITLVFFVILKPRAIPKFICHYNTEIKALFNIGWPIFLFGVVKLFMSTVDKFVVVSYLGIQQLGYYNVTATFLAITTLLGGLISRVLSPYLVFKVGEGVLPRDLYAYFLDKMSKSLIIISLSISLLLLSLQPFLWYVLPEYIRGNKAGLSLIICGGISSITQFYTVYLVAHSKQRAVLLATLFSVCVISFLVVGVALLSNDISYIALGSLLGWSLYFLLLSKISHKVSASQIKYVEGLMLVVKPIFIMSLCAIILVVIQSLIHAKYGSFILDLMFTLLLYIVLFITSNKFLGAGTLIKSGFDRLLRK